MQYFFISSPGAAHMASERVLVPLLVMQGQATMKLLLLLCAGFDAQLCCCLLLCCSFQGLRTCTTNAPPPTLSSALCTFCRWRKLATLEFDRDRKSMSVICSAPMAAPAASSGVQTRRTTPSSAGSNVLLVKGAAECLLGRSSHVSLPLASPALHAPASHSLGACQLSLLPRTLSQI